MTNLKSCPFCGARNEKKTREHLEIQESFNGQWCVFCRFCGACGPENPTQDEAVMDWNKRINKRLTTTESTEIV